MLLLFPFIAYVAVVTSAALLGMLYAYGELGPAQRVVLPVWLLLAGYCQFFGSSAAVATLGLVLQTCLAIYLLLCWKVML